MDANGRRSYDSAPMMERVGDLFFITSNTRVLSATHCF
jgi:hypothetical protein